MPDDDGDEPTIDTLRELLPDLASEPRLVVKGCINAWQEQQSEAEYLLTHSRLEPDWSDRRDAFLAAL